MQWSRIVGFALTAFVLVPVLSGAQTLPYEYRTILDTDDNPANGCSVVVGADQFQGAETLITIFVDPSSTSVTLVEVQSCLAGVWSSPVIVDASGWPIGLDIGVGGADVVEGYLPITLRSARLGFTAAANLSSDVLFTDDGGGSIGLLFLADIPVNSGPGLLIFIVLMAAAGLLALRRGYGVAAVALFCASATVVGVGVVLACQPDGDVGEWAGLAPTAVDVIGDAIPDDSAADLVAVFGVYDAGELCIRLDVADLEIRGIDIEKSTNGQDADLPPGPNLTPGDPVSWAYVVTNTGAVALSNVTVSDDQGVAVSCPTASLAVGELMTCTGSGIATAGQYGNIGTATGDPLTGPAVSNTDPSHYLGVVSTLSINDVTVSEDSGDAVFTVAMSQPAIQPVTVNYATVDGTGVAGVDYIATSGTLTFAPGETTKTVSVPIVEDLVYEGPETFSVNLSNPTNATILDGQGLGTILDNDAMPMLSINDVTVSEDSGDAVFTVAMSQPASWPVTVDYATTDGTATAGEDYVATSGTLTFAPGETTKMVSVPIVEDLVYEASETFSANLINPNNATLSDDQGLGTILDNDPPPSLLGKIAINEIGVNPVPDGRSFVELMSLVVNASDTTPAQMQQLGLYIVGQNGQVVRINQGFVSNTLPAEGTMVAYEDGLLEIRNKHGSVRNIGSDADWTDYGEVYIGGAWVSYDPSIHDFSFGDSTADPVLVNIQQSGISIDFFVANDPVPDASPAEVMNGTWYSPIGAPAPEGDFSSFDGSFTDDIVFARVFIAVGTQPFVIEPGEIDSDTAADWTTNSTPTVALIGLNPTQVAGANPHNDDGQTVLFGTESGDVIEGEEGPDFLFGRGGDDTVAGGGGDDLVHGGLGDDELYGGTGDDVFADSDSVFDTPGGSSVVDGGQGIDSLRFTTGGGPTVFQLTNALEVATRLTGIEFLDMRDGDGLDTLTLSVEAVVALGDTNNAGTMVGGVDILVRGDAGGGADRVDLLGNGWVLDAGGSVTLGSETFDIWIENSGVPSAVVAIQQGLEVNTAVP